MLKWMVLVFTALATTLPAAAQNDVTLPEGTGKAVVQRMCVGCHKLSVITSKHATKDQWSMIVQQMVSRGADGTDEDIDTVVDYLSKNFPSVEQEKTDPSPQSSLEQHIGPNAWQCSLLTMSHTNLEAMLRYWQQYSTRSQSVRMQQKEKHERGSGLFDISLPSGERQIFQPFPDLPKSSFKPGAIAQSNLKSSYLQN